MENKTHFPNISLKKDEINPGTPSKMTNLFLYDGSIYSILPKKQNGKIIDVKKIWK